MIDLIAADRSLNSIVDILNARSQDSATAYIFLPDGTSNSEVRWTFAETLTHSRAFAAHLDQRGVGTGDRVMLSVNPGLDYIAALYGILSLGAVAVPCFPPLRRKELDRFHAIASDCTPAAVVVDQMYRAQVTTSAMVVTPEPMYATAPASAAYAPPKPGDLALIQYTSGSTGIPKGVCLTHDNLLSNCEALDRNMGEDPERVGLSWLPPYHDMGLIGTIILSMWAGWPLVLMSPLHFIQQPRRWLEAITAYRVSITVGPNFSLGLCADALAEDGASDLDLSTVRELYCGAEPVRADTVERFTAGAAPAGFDANALIPCYGMAEATLFVAGKPRGARYRTARSPDGRTVVSCGTVDSEHSARIVDPATLRALPDGDLGEIWIAGRNVAAGYHRQDSGAVFGARLPADSRRYLRTGDLGFLSEGELFVTGRIKDLIIVNGRNIYPQDVEAAAVQADPALLSAVAFGVGGTEGEQVCVVVETANQSAAHQLTGAVRRNVTTELGVCPRVQLSPRRTIPTTTSGKVCRQQARAMYLAGELPSLAIQDRDVLASRLAYLTVGLPTIGTVAAIAYALHDGLWLSDVALFLGMYLITALGVEAGLHRYFTHRSFDASAPVKVFLGIAGSMAAQGPVVFWVANHRLHHAFADTDRDPHSPQPQGPGLTGRLKGLWHGHMGWLFRVRKTDWSRHTRDWLADRAVMKTNAHYFTLVLAGIVVPGVIGWLATQSVHGLVGGVLWGGFARIFALDHATWAVNSLGHTIGNREFELRDHSGNIATLAPPTLGGSWHNNHHARPSLAQTRRHWWQLDLAGEFIRVLDWAGLVHNVRYVHASSEEATT